MQEMRATKAADQFLKGVSYPISKGALVSAAREAKLVATVQQALAKLPEREYEDAKDVTTALNAQP
jgi:hypothetical protein